MPAAAFVTAGTATHAVTTASEVDVCCAQVVLAEPAASYPGSLVVAEAERSGPVTNLQIPSFCVTEITDQARFSNDGLASRPFSQWAADFDAELHRDGPRLQTQFGRNRMGL